MRRVAALLALATISLTGCYGSTAPATDIGPEAATLRGHGTANSGPATSWFEYWITGSERMHHTTARRNWPAGASGPIHEPVKELAASSSYSFALCGEDAQTEPVCAQTRTFTTRPAVEDAVRGYWETGCCSRLDVKATSAPSGANSRGVVTFHVQSSGPPDPHDFVGLVTCMRVDGARAAVGAVGHWEHQGSPHEDAALLITIEDGRTKVDTLHYVETPGTALPNCATADFAHQFVLTDGLHQFIVNDASP